MAFVLFKRISFLKLMKNPLLLPKQSRSFALKASSVHDHEREYFVSSRINLSPLFPTDDETCLKDCKIEVIDDESWQVSCFRSEKNGTSCFISDPVDSDDIRTVKSASFEKVEEPDFDDIDDMRIRRNLYYKMDMNSREYEEYKFDFHRKKSWKKEKDEKENEENYKKKETSKHILVSVAEKNSKKDHTKKKTEGIAKEVSTSDPLINNLRESRDLGVAKKLRTPSFNQVTAPYHEPFCLDIYISKGSVRASIIHRATSNVVVVSHSISKDMKFDLDSTKNRNACVAVGEMLARRALADDIHNVVYTPRRGERLEGKLETVVRSIVYGGIDVKVKLKQQKTRRRQLFSSTTQR